MSLKFLSNQTTDNKIGIGANVVPTYALDVVSSVVNNSARFRNSAGGDTLVRIIAGDYNTEIDARLFIGEDDAHGMTFEYDGSANIGYIGMNNNVDPTGAWSKRIQMSRGGTEVAFMAGNVGIGNTGPYTKLLVGSRGTAAATSISAIDGLAFDFYNDGPPYKRHGVIISQAGDASESVLDFNTKAASGTNSTKMTILGNGNVGIGTTNPTSLLHIEPSAAVETEVKIVGGGSSGQRYTGPWLSLTRKGPYDDYGIKYYTESTLNWFVGVPYQGGSGNSYQKFIIGTSATAGTGTVATFDYLGNVGIGTDSPGSILDVSYGASASNTASINLNGDNGAAAELVLRAGGDDGGTIYNRRAAIRYYSNQISTTAAQWVNGVSMTQTTGDDKFYFNNSGNSTVLCLQQNGRVGINTPTPTQELHVQGGMRLTGAFVDKNATAGSYYQVLSSTQTGTDWVDASSPTIIGGPYLPLAGGTMTAGGTTYFPDNTYLNVGTSGDAVFFHNGTNTVLRNYTGDFYIDNYSDDKSIIFRNDDGTGNVETYFQLEGASGGASPFTVFPDNSNLAFGSGHDLRLYHNGSVSYITNYTGTLDISNNADNADINFRNDNGAGGVSTYFYLDGSLTNGTTILGATRFPDNSKIYMGTGGDLEIYHDGSNSYIKDNGTGTLNLQGSTQVIIGGTNGEVGVQYVENAGVGLRHNNVAKLTTESFGIIVLGDIKIDSALLSNQENTDIDTGAEVVAQVAYATYTAAFFDFVVKKGTNVRSGTVYACHNGDTTPLVEFTETSTQDLGDTSDVTLSVDISGTTMRLLATVTSDDWSVKSLIRAI